MDVFNSIGFEYLFAMPGSSFAEIHESILNYSGNKAPKYITCMHEESSVRKLKDLMPLAVFSLAVGHPHVAVLVREDAVREHKHARAKTFQQLAGGVEFEDGREVRIRAEFSSHRSATQMRS
jgi:hypothetical protein